MPTRSERRGHVGVGQPCLQLVLAGLVVLLGPFHVRAGGGGDHRHVQRRHVLGDCRDHLGAVSGQSQVAGVGHGCIDAQSTENHRQHQRHQRDRYDFPPDRPVAHRPPRRAFRGRGFRGESIWVVVKTVFRDRRIHPFRVGKHSHRTAAVLPTAPLICSVRASFIGLPANRDPPRGRPAGDIRMAIRRV
ncbi:hypothetical protein I552_8938 [Mycobacterium xenopi 3993]|nr:hypothetical protein I552_8938 [Mycobacterium xenopi 3993]